MDYVLCLASAISILTSMVFIGCFPFFIAFKTLYNKFELLLNDVPSNSVCISFSS
jgi:hypothetical protein